MRHRPQIIVVLLFPVSACIVMALLVALFWSKYTYTARDIFSQKFSGDVLGVVADAPLTGQAVYDVDLSSSMATLSLDIEGPFQGMVRILAPFDIHVLSRDFFVEESLLNFHVFQRRITLKEKTKKTYKFRYQRDAELAPYLLTLLPNNETLQYQVTAHFPDYFKLQSSDAKIEGTEARYMGSAKASKLLRIDTEVSDAPLTLVASQFHNASSVELEFNISLDAESAEDGLNFSLKDRNEKNIEVTDRVFVERTAVNGRQLLLHLRGVTLQRGEWYELTLKDLKGKNGKLLSENPLVVRLVQSQDL